MALETEIINETLFLTKMGQGINNLKDVIYITSEISKLVNIMMDETPITVCEKLKLLMIFFLEALRDINDRLFDINDNLEDMSLEQQIKSAVSFWTDINIVSSIQTRITEIMITVSSEITKIKDTQVPKTDVLESALATMNDKILAMKYTIIAMKSDLITKMR